MKIRNGFVSNSSSSSFIIGLKNEIDLKEKLDKIFDLPDKHILKPISKQITQTLIDCARYSYSYADYIRKEDPSDEDLELVNGCKRILVGYAANDNGGLEEMVCEMSLNYKDDDCIIMKDGGF